MPLSFFDSTSSKENSILNSKAFYERRQIHVCGFFSTIYTGLSMYVSTYLPNLQDVRIPFQKFVESLSSELTFRLKLKLDPRLHFEFMPAGINLSVKVKQDPKPDTLLVNLGFRIRILIYADLGFLFLLINVAFNQNFIEIVCLIHDSMFISRESFTY
jgi:hypothetical protein